MSGLLDHQRYVIFDGPQQFKAPGTRYFAADGTSTESKSKAAKFFTTTDAIVFAKHHSIEIDEPNSIGIEDFTDLQLADELPASSPADGISPKGKDAGRMDDPKVRHEFYKEHDIRSSPVEFDKHAFKVRLDITLPPVHRTSMTYEYLDDERFYPTIEEAHVAGFNYGRSLIDEGIPKPSI